MSADERPILLAIQHVPWEGPHRILDACGGLDVHTVKPLAGQSLPDHDQVAGGVVMGGPMNVDEVDVHPEMVREARVALGDSGAAALPAQAEAAEADLLARTTPGLEAFASLVKSSQPH